MVYVVVYVVVYVAATVWGFSASEVDCERLEVCVGSPVGCLGDRKRRYVRNGMTIKAAKKKCFSNSIKIYITFSDLQHLKRTTKEIFFWRSSRCDQMPHYNVWTCSNMYIYMYCMCVYIICVFVLYI